MPSSSSSSSSCSPATAVSFRASYFTVPLPPFARSFFRVTCLEVGSWGMEAYVLFARAKEDVIRFEEQEEDIGCPSESSAARSTSSSSDGVGLADDASSSAGSTCHFEMASLMTHLPIKRGLSKFFDGKSQSFASLAAVGGLEDLPKPPAKRLKTSWSCGVGLKDARRGPPSVTTVKKQASRARLTPSAPRRLVPARPLVTARPEAAGKPLLFA